MKVNRALKKPKVLILFSKRGAENSTRFKGFVNRLKKHGAFKYADVEVAALEDLIFVFKSDEMNVVDIRLNRSLSTFDIVYFKGWESKMVEAYCVSRYLSQYGIPYFDEAVAKNQNPHHKLAATTVLSLEGLPVVPTIFTANHNLVEAMQKYKWKYPVIVKSATGQKGQHNYLVKTQRHLTTILHKHPNTAFMIQKFIPNNGDWRIMVLGGKAKLGIFRKAAQGSHLNNTSAGAQATFCKTKDTDPQVIEIAEQSASKLDIQVAGVDVIENKKSSELYILEVNIGSQVATGAFVDEKIKAFDDFFYRATRRRYGLRRKVQSAPKRIIGRHELVDLPDFGIENITAKTDTGAYSSALHAENIRIKKVKGKDELHFSVPVFENGLNKTATFVECSSKEFSTADVRNSFGNWQKRYKIKIRVIIQGRQYETEVTLSNRESQRCPMLIGRKVLRGNFLVNVELSRKEVEI